METNERNNMRVVVLVLILIIVILGGYFVYDKVLYKNTTPEVNNNEDNKEDEKNKDNNDTDNTNNDTQGCKLNFTYVDTLANIKSTHNLPSFELIELNDGKLYVKVVEDSGLTDICFANLIIDKYYEIHSTTKNIIDTVDFPFAAITNGFYVLYSDGSIEKLKFSSDYNKLIEIEKLDYTNIEKFEEEILPGCDTGACGSNIFMYVVDKDNKRHLLYDIGI